MMNPGERQLTCANGHDVARVRDPGRGSRTRPAIAPEMIVRLTCAACGRDSVRTVDLDRIGDGQAPSELLTCVLCDAIQGFANFGLRLLCVHCPRCSAAATERLPAPIIDLEAAPEERTTVEVGATT